MRFPVGGCELFIQGSIWQQEGAHTVELCSWGPLNALHDRVLLFFPLFVTLLPIATCKFARGKLHTFLFLKSMSVIP